MATRIYTCGHVRGAQVVRIDATCPGGCRVPASDPAIAWADCVVQELPRGTALTMVNQVHALLVRAYQQGATNATR